MAQTAEQEVLTFLTEKFKEIEQKGYQRAFDNISQLITKQITEFFDKLQNDLTQPIVSPASSDFSLCRTTVRGQPSV